MSSIITPKHIKPYQSFSFVKNTPKLDIARLVKDNGFLVPKTYKLEDLDKARFENPHSFLFARSESRFELTLPVSDLANSICIDKEDSQSSIMEKIINKKTIKNIEFLTKFYRNNNSFPSKEELQQSITASIWEYIQGINHTIWQDPHEEQVIHILCSRAKEREGMYSKIKNNSLIKQVGNLKNTKKTNKALISLSNTYKRICSLNELKTQETVPILECQTREQDYKNFFLQFSNGPKKEYKNPQKNQLQNLSKHNLQVINTNHVRGISNGVEEITITYAKVNNLVPDTGSLIQENSFENDQLSRFKKFQGIIAPKYYFDMAFANIADNHCNKNSFIFPQVSAIFSQYQIDKLISQKEQEIAMEYKLEGIKDSSFKAYLQSDGKTATLWRSDI
ncbi:MAG: hypothetical protein ACLFNM_03335 [Candidatus Woesearchaeota archaeon]